MAAFPGSGAGKVALTKIGTGTLTLPTANTYAGDTTVSVSPAMAEKYSTITGAANK